MVRSLCILFLILLGLTSSPCQPEAGEQSLNETEVMAAMLYNFTKYVEWPDGALPANSQLTMCIAAQSPVFESFARYHNRQSNGKILKIRMIGSSQEAAGCNLLFIDHSQQGQMAAYLLQTVNMPVLTVSNIGEFATTNGIIEFLRLDEQIRFEVNLEQSKRSRLVISSKLLKLAKKIH